MTGSALRFDVYNGDVKVDSLTVANDRVLVGSGAHCDVRLPATECASEQAVIEGFAGAIRISIKSTRPPVFVDGRRVDEGATVLGSILTIGATSLHIALTASIDAGAKLPAGESRRSLLVVGVGFVALLGLGYLWLGAGGGPRQALPPTKIWDDAPSVCPATDPTEAAAMAQVKLANAEARAQRHPFYLAEGVEAVRLYGVASACLRLVGPEAKGEADDARDAGRELRQRIDMDYRVRRLRLEYALSRKDIPTVASEVSMLRELLAGKSGPYAEWLNHLGRTMKVEKEAE